MPQSDYNVSINVRMEDGTSGPAKAAAKSLQALGKAAKNTRLAESLGKPSDLARAALAKLDKALLSGELKLDTYEDAVRGVQKSFGLVTPEAQEAATGLQSLDRQLSKGEISADQYQKELGQLARSLDMVEDEAVETKRGLVDMSSVMQGVGQAVGGALAGMAQQLPQVIMDLGQLGIDAQASGQRFERFAGGTRQAAMFLESFNEGTQGTVDRMAAMSSAGRLLQMGLVSTGDEMEQVSSIAVKLGDQTMGAGDRIADFAALLANQSVPRLDNFGISSGRVRQRIDELLKSGQALDREQAFKMAVMEEGAKSLERLGDTSDTAAHKISTLKAAVQDAKIGIGEMLIGVVETSDALEKFDVAARIRGLPQAAEQTISLARALHEAITAAKMGQNPFEVYENSLKRAAAASVDFGTATEEVRWAHTTTLPVYEQEAQAVDELTAVQRMARSEMDGLNAEQNRLAMEAFGVSEALSTEAAAASIAAAAMAETIAVTEASVLSNASLAASLKDATDAQIAQAAISQLGTALQEGQIDAETYATAVQETQLSFGLADEQSIFLTNSLTGLTDALASGSIKADEYDEALGDVIMEANAAGVSVSEFAAVLEALPEKKIVTLEVRTTRTGSGGSVNGGGVIDDDPPEFAHGGTFLVGEGGPEMVTVQPLAATNTFNDTFNIYDGRAMAAVTENRRRQRRSGYARTM